MEEIADSTVPDVSGNHHDLTINGTANWVVDAPTTSILPVDTKSLSLDGSTFANSTDGSSALCPQAGYTIEAWIKASSGSGGDEGIVGNWNGNGYLLYSLNHNASTPLGAIYGTGSFLQAITPTRDNGWHYISQTWDGFTVKIYIDGNLENSVAFSTAPNCINGNFAISGYAFPLQSLFTGQIDEVKLYDYARSASQIVEDAGIVAGTFPSPTPTPTITPTPTDTPTPTLTPIPSDTPTPTPSDTPTPTTTPILSSTPTPTPTTSATGGPIAYWPMEETSGVTVSDASGNHHDLTINGTANWVVDAPTTSILPVDTKSLSLDGSTFASSTDGSSALCPQAGYTIEAWIKAPSGSGGDEGIAGNYQGGGYLLYGFNHSASTPLGGAFNGGSSSIQATTSTRDKGWHYLSLTWDGSTVKVYIDGTEENSQSLNDSPSCIGGNFAISGYGSSLGHLFTGNIDEVKLYDYARSASQIVTDAGIIAGTFPSPTPTPTITPTPTDTPTPTLAPSATPTPQVLGSVVINEIMWPGSTVSSADEWIELKNTTSSPIDLTNWEVDNLGDSTTPNIIIPTAAPNRIIGGNGYYLIANNLNSSSIISIDPDFHTTALNLSNTGEQLTLKNNTGDIIDVANHTGSWFAGINLTPNKSMSRNTPPGDGAIISNWFTSTGSVNLDPGASESATPKADNI